MKINKLLYKKKWIYILAYLYLILSILIFLIGNVKPIISIPTITVIVIALNKAIKNAPNMEVNLLQEKKKILIILFLILCWVIFGGIGGFVWQNTWDHKFRNAIFMDLINYRWPVIRNTKALCYYLGFWLPAALFGKIFGLNAGYIFQVFWAFLGIFIAFGLMCQYFKKIKISNLIIFIFFSGLYIFLYLFFSSQSITDSLNLMLKGQHIEIITKYFNSSSNTTLIFWLYNQIIPFWVGFMLLLQQKNNKSVVFIYSLMVLFSPFPLVALAPVLVYLILKNDTKKINLKSIKKNVKSACTFENISSLLIIIIIGLFYKSNIAVNKMGIININFDVIIKYLSYLFFEFGIYLIFIYKKNRTDVILNILIIISLILPFISMGNSYDFSWRTCIPLTFYIMLLVIKEINDNNNKYVKWSLIFILCLGSITPITEMIRTYNNEKLVLTGLSVARSDSLPSTFQKKYNECYKNFMANVNSAFYKYLSKK